MQNTTKVQMNTFFMPHISFVLVEPHMPQNVGAAARALKTMAFDDLRLVNSDAHTKDAARWLAHGSTDILQQAQHFESLRDAVADCDVRIATTARHRTRFQEYHEPRALLNILSGKGASIQRAALVFGREESGLSNREIALCELVSSIPMNVDYPSLNLGQAVMLYAYEMSPVVVQKHAFPTNSNAGSREHQRLRERTERLLVEVGIPRSSALFGRVLERLALLRHVDIHLAHSVLRRIEARIEHPKSDIP